MLRRIKPLFSVFAIWAVGAVAAGESGSESLPFFAMDTAVQDLSRIDMLEELGYDGVGWRFENYQQLSTSVARIRESGLNLHAVYANSTLTQDGMGFRGDIDTRLEAIAGTGAVLWLAVKSSEFPPSDPAGDAVAVPELRRLAERAAKHGVRIALYPHAGAWIERHDDALRLARQVDRENFGISFNLAHALRVGDEARIPAILSDAGPLLFLVSLNGADRDAAGEAWDRLVRPLDEGDFDLAGLLRELGRVGYHGPVGLQAFGVSVPPRENLRRSIEAWRRLQADALLDNGAGAAAER